MFIGRKDELKQLEAVYDSDHSNILVVYGRDGIGKTTLAQKFTERKQFLYYHAVEASTGEQDRRLKEVFDGLAALPADKKPVLVVDEFQLIVSDYFYSTILELVKNPDKKVMMLLLSSSVNWVENSMVSEKRDFARMITGIIKLRELSYAEMVEWFPRSTSEDCITLRALFGGVPKYLVLWQENRRAKENIISLFFTPDSPLKKEAEYLLKLELRELGAYNTILTALASGRFKLNDIYVYTGFSRAKISVYLKNLIEMGLVEKIYSENVKNSENTMKGLYRIRDNFLSFYYAFVFPYISEIESGKGRTVYNDKVLPALEAYLRPYFADVCKEFLDLMSKYRKLGYRYSDWRRWYGKKGTLDIVGSDQDRHQLVAICSMSDRHADVELYEELESLISDAGLKPSKKCIFTRNGYTSELKKKASEHEVLLVDMSEM